MAKQKPDLPVLKALSLGPMRDYGVGSAPTKSDSQGLGCHSGRYLALHAEARMKSTLLGAGVGIPAAVALTRLLKNLQFGVGATVPPSRCCSRA